MENLSAEMQGSEMIHCAAPYNVQSTPLHTDGDFAYETLSPGVFTASLARRPSVRLHRGHDGPMIGRVRPYETAEGLLFSWDGELPEDFRGFSVRFRMEEYRRIGPACFVLAKARLRHIAMLSGDERPAYPSTRLSPHADTRFQEVTAGKSARKP